MCFSPEADLTTGVIVCAVGVDALRHVRRPQQIVIAALPMLFGLHQIDESFVWWGLRGQVAPSVMHIAVYVFLSFAFLLPFLVPLALFDVEPRTTRRMWMGILLAAGAITSALLLVPLFTGPVGASIDGSHIAYSADLSYSLLLGGSYIVVTCGALLLSSSRVLEVFGVVNLAVAVALAWVTFTGVTSLWCAFAAITSIVIAIYLRRSPPLHTAISPT
jgi:hypothetical protein